MRKKLLRLSLAVLSLTAALAVHPRAAMAFVGCPQGNVQIFVGNGFIDCYYVSGLDCSSCTYYCVDLGGTVNVNMCEE